jgi:hypothetical protein
MRQTDGGGMDLSWADVAQPVVGGLAGILGVWLIEGSLRALRRQGVCPERWNRGRGQGRP